MLKIAIAAVALAVFPVAAAHAEDARSFSRDGVDYTYTAEQNGNETVIKGTASGNVPFRLVVSGDRVTGTYNSQPVSFRTKDVSKTTATTLAANGE